nr:integrase, catalytic region, zinc finger, CCHC-type, peptidase aspartic, catalytic [Tanacetum cinerariifolium]
KRNQEILTGKEKQTEPYAEQAFWSQYSVQTDEPNLSGTTIVEVPKELPKVSMVNSCLKRLIFHLASFDMVVKERTTTNAITEGTWGSNTLKLAFAKDTVILKMKEKLNSLNGDVKDGNVKRDVEEIETLNIELDHKVTKLAAKNEHLKQTYKQLYDSIKSSLREIVKNERLLNPLNTSLDYALNNNKKIRFIEHIPSSGNTPIKIASSTNLVSNKPVISSTGVNLLTSASGSQPQGNTKKDRIHQTQSRAKKNKLEDHSRNVRPILHNKKCIVNTKAVSSVPNSKLNANSDLKCDTCNGCLFSDNHDSCVLEFINYVNARVKSKSAKKPVNKKI